MSKLRIFAHAQINQRWGQRSDIFNLLEKEEELCKSLINKQFEFWPKKFEIEFGFKNTIGIVVLLTYN